MSKELMPTLRFLNRLLSVFYCSILLIISFNAHWYLANFMAFLLFSVILMDDQGIYKLIGISRWVIVFVGTIIYILCVK